MFRASDWKWGQTPWISMNEILSLLIASFHLWNAKIPNQSQYVLALTKSLSPSLDWVFSYTSVFTYFHEIHTDVENTTKFAWLNDVETSRVIKLKQVFCTCDSLILKVYGFFERFWLYVWNMVCWREFSIFFSDIKYISRCSTYEMGSVWNDCYCLQ